MTLLSTRTKLIDLSGRYDLVTERVGYTDNGANWFINEAQKMLSRMVSASYSFARLYDELTAGNYYKTFTGCRAIKEVWINTSTARTRLDRRDFEVLKEYYDELLSEIDQGTPLYYTEARLRSTDDTDKDAQGAFADYVLDDSESHEGILFMPPNDETIVLEVAGLFYETTLSTDADESFWTERHEGTLVKASLYQLEVMNRNREGMKDWLEALNIDMVEIEKDAIEQEIVEVTALEG